MREWFTAFKTQNTTHRDYRPYFKPILVYLEGAWTTSTDLFEESFESDRHFTDAESWYDLQEKIRFTSYTGRKNVLENFSYLPTTVIDFINDTIPVTAQWNYRIMCHPLENDLPTNRLRVVDDLATRMRDQSDFLEYNFSRAARFQLNPVDSDDWATSFPRHQFLDDLMEQVPGKNNYGANIVDDTIDGKAYPVTGDVETPLNTAYYHRVFRVNKKDAMGLDSRRRGFNDQNIFMAATTHEKIAPMKATFCQGSGKKKKCEEYSERWTYAIPLEIIYLTPLSSWNPYNLEYRGKADSKEGNKVKEGKSGGINNPYDGINSRVYYMTPAHFYSGSDSAKNDPADTSTGAKWILDRSGTAQKVSASGVRIIMQPIAGVGSVRQRYPIMPLHDDGNTIYKELEALKDIVLEPEKYAHMLRGGTVTKIDEGLTLKLGSSKPNEDGIHEHYVELTGDELERMYMGKGITKETSRENGHSHVLKIGQFKDKSDNSVFYKYLQCDDSSRCFDGHPPKLFIQDI